MVDLLGALLDPEISFLRNAFIVGALASVAFGVVGTYVVTKRISYIASAISHSVLGGIGAGLFLQRGVGLAWSHPMLGALIAALASALVIGVVSLRGRQREDSVIGAIWAAGMAVGLVFLSLTPGYVDPMSYLFGNILLVSQADVWIVLALDVLVVILGLAFYRQFLAIAFDEEYAGTRGVRVGAFYLLLLCLTALTVVLLVSVVGIVLVIALITLPAAVAGHFSGRLWQMMGLAVVFCLLFVVAGLALSYALNWPGGPTIIIIAALAYLAVALGGRLRGAA